MNRPDEKEDVETRYSSMENGASPSSDEKKTKHYFFPRMMIKTILRMMKKFKKN